VKTEKAGVEKGMFSQKIIFKKILAEVSESILNALWMFFIQRQQTTYTPTYLIFPSISGLPH